MCSSLFSWFNLCQTSLHTASCSRALYISQGSNPSPPLWTPTLAVSLGPSSHCATALPWPTSRASMLEWADGSISSVNCTRRTLWSSEKNIPRPEEARIEHFGFNSNIPSGEMEALLITWTILSLKWSLMVAALCCGPLFQRQVGVKIHVPTQQWPEAHSQSNLELD